MSSCLRCHFVFLSGLVLLLVLSAAQVNGQPGTCVRWQGQPKICDQFPQWNEDTFVYIPEGNTLSEFAATASAIIDGLGLIHENDTSIDGRCNLFFVRMMCLTYFRPCLVVPTADSNETVIPQPMQPCRSICDDYDVTCRNNSESRGYPFGVVLWFPQNYSFPLTCEEMENGAPFYQSEVYNVTTSEYPDQTFTGQCNSLDAQRTNIYCDEPLANSGNNQCSYKCPLPAYSDSQYDSAKVMQLVLGWFSWAGSLVLILSYALHPTLRKFPSNLIMMCALAAHFASVGMIIPTFSGYENLWCGLDGAYLRPHVEAAAGLHVYFDIEDLSVESSLCTFQGWLLQTGLLSSTMWWGIVSLNMFLSLFFRAKLPEDNTCMRIAVLAVLHVCGWGIPALVMLVPAAAGKIVFAPGALFCNVGSMDDGVWLIVFWALPVGIILLVGVVCFVASLARLMTYFHGMKEFKKTAVTYVRIIVFITIFLCLYIFIFAYTIRVETDKEDIEDGYGEYFQCLLRSETAPYCELSESVHNFSLAMLKSFAYSSLGLLLFLNFCLSQGILHFWQRFFSNVARGNFKSAITSDRSTSQTKTPKKSKGSKGKGSQGDHMTMTMTMSENAAEESLN
ncbi:Frizzled-10 [Balamuthia mandrillaris]